MKKILIILIIILLTLWPTPAQASRSEQLTPMSRLQRAIGGCESSGDPRGPLRYTTVNKAKKGQKPSTASGAYQILDGTWAGWRKDFGKGLPGVKVKRAKFAPPRTQDILVARVLKTTKPGDKYFPWKASQHCWGRFA